jgi:hypothetical protein
MYGYPEGGAWWNNWGDFKGAISNEVLNPNSDLRSGRFLNKVESVAQAAPVAARVFGPQAVGVATAGLAGLRAFRNFTGLGAPYGMYGGARRRPVKEAGIEFIRPGDRGSSVSAQSMRLNARRMAQAANAAVSHWSA